MKKFLLLLTIFFLSIGNLSAQRDTEHWIAPFYESTSLTGRSVYLSTDSVTSFPVTIYGYTVDPVNPVNPPIQVVLGTVNISKGSPQTFIIPVANISINNAGLNFTKTTRGVYLNATKPFYCTLRIASSTTHAEILTSKGKAGIGKEFFVANTPSTAVISGNNFTAGVLATENNTVVTATWNPGVTFLGGNVPAGTTTHTFTLNRGESFIFAGSAGGAAPFMGAKIVADKPITLTNGNINGNFGANTSAGSDEILDQSVPVERLGSTFAMVRTRSATADDLEGGIVIATEDNTQVFLNGAGTAVATLNQGQWYRISGSNYITQGSGHENMFISTSKNVYLYQLVSVNNSSATCGFNYIPPLNCFLPRRIDEIGKVNEMPTGGGGASVKPSGIQVKLNILTEAGAVVTVNGVPPTAAEGPFLLTGNTTWVTYSLIIPTVTDNLTIVSSKAVTAGINGGFSTSGYGGYFAGFSSIPVISKQTGNCIPGIILEVDDGYDSYQWNLNGVAIPGATQNTYTPTVAGDYTCTVTVGGCPPATTPIYKVFTCLVQTTTNLAACAAITITPTFTSSTQTPVPSTVTIVTPPTHGTAVINPTTGVITYTPTSGYVGPDTLVYQFCGNAPEFIDCQQVTVNFTAVPYPVVQDAALSTCFLETNNATGQFDLSTAVVTLQSPVTKEYFPSFADATNGTNQIMGFLTYIAPSSEVFVRVYNSGGCFRIAKITLTVKPPKKSAILVDQYICAEDTTTLDAGPGFQSYLWSTGATTQSISNVSVGVYTVTLFTDGCPTVQTVTVHAVTRPIVTNIDIVNNAVTLTVTGGTPPYKYSVDNVVWQDSNTFSNLPRGQNTFYVKDTYDCEPVIVEVTVPNLVNAITPNGDGSNDYVDYSALAYKTDLKFSIYDRYGNLVHIGDKTNNYRWDGKFSDRKVHTGTYWYHINWTEPTPAKTPVKFTGWILVKNRE
ncbi:T9SS type B sorting domain-containing protein [Chryseobacterium sp.]|uniref:T9SS type B sorting domain-containing protein n=1 Tax=Chryseobacterium sp. TaxID=1871047 RepID=UPI0011CC0A17|nr:T9SS type B sorting domain-containing protein [Chryseobacterium sp.]TXF77210.1 T9SS type B sorting domain-containing protein [Chryseobacterium sp.]